MFDSIITRIKRMYAKFRLALSKRRAKATQRKINRRNARIARLDKIAATPAKITVFRHPLVVMAGLKTRLFASISAMFARKSAKQAGKLDLRIEKVGQRHERKIAKVNATRAKVEGQVMQLDGVELPERLGTIEARVEHVNELTEKLVQIAKAKEIAAETVETEVVTVKANDGKPAHFSKPEPGVKPVKV